MKNNSRPDDSNMTEAALAALREQGFSRRQFLKGSGALVVAFSVAEFADRLGIAPETMLAQGGNTPQTLDSWIAIGADGNVTVYTGTCRHGPGHASRCRRSWSPRSSRFRSIASASSHAIRR